MDVSSGSSATSKISSTMGTWKRYDKSLYDKSCNCISDTLFKVVGTVFD